MLETVLRVLAFVTFLLFNIFAAVFRQIVTIFCSNNKIAIYFQFILIFIYPCLGGPHKAIENALQIGCRSFAFFVRNQRRWDSKPLSDEDIVMWKATLKVNLMIV